MAAMDQSEEKAMALAGISPDEEPASDDDPLELIDFLYKDSARISSFYAQTSKGRLTLVETTKGTRNANESVSKQLGRANVYVATGEVASESKDVRESHALRKEVVDPHDFATTTVLNKLLFGEHVWDDLDNAPNGSLVIADGTLAFLDKSLVDIARLSLDAATSKSKDKNIVIAKQILAKLVTPSIFLVQSENDALIAGTLNEASLSEPIASYYYKHGAAGLSGVTIIGIKEAATLPLRLSEVSLIGASLPILKLLSELFIPSEATRVTPICIYRRLL